MLHVRLAWQACCLSVRKHIGRTTLTVASERCQHGGILHVGACHAIRKTLPAFFKPARRPRHFRARQRR
jgi:hypothetical protein